MAQNTWVPGYIITLEGDTIYGDLEVRSPALEAYSCSFRNAKDRGRANYLPDEILGYRYEDGRYFVSHSHENVEEGRKVFLEFLVAGRVNIYHLRINSGQGRYFAQTDSFFKELTQTEVLVYDNNSTYLRENKEYIGILNYMLLDAAMTDEIMKSSLNPKSLIKISTEYQKRVCPEEDCIIYTREMEKTKLRWSLSFDIASQNLSFGKIANSDKRSVPGFTLRIEAVDILPFRSNISLFTGFNLYSINSHNLYPGVINSVIRYNDQWIHLIKEGSSSRPYSIARNIDMKTIMIGIPVVARYRFFSGKVQPYVSGGIEASFCMSQNDKLEIPWFYSRFGKSIPDFYLGYILGAGTSFQTIENKSIFLEANYHRSQNMDINESLRLTLERFSFSIGYEF